MSENREHGNVILHLNIYLKVSGVLKGVIDYNFFIFFLTVVSV